MHYCQKLEKLSSNFCLCTITRNSRSFPPTHSYTKARNWRTFPPVCSCTIARNLRNFPPICSIQNLSEIDEEEIGYVVCGIQYEFPYLIDINTDINLYSWTSSTHLGQIQCCLNHSNVITFVLNWLVGIKQSSICVEHAGASRNFLYDAPSEILSQRFSRPTFSNPWHRSGYERRTIFSTNL